MGLMGKGPAEWSQSIPNRKVNDASISTTFKLILNWYGPITTSSSITLLQQSGGRNFRMLGPSSSLSSYPQGLYTAQRANIKTTPIINQHCRYYLGPTRHQNRKRVRVGCPIGGDLIIGEGNHPRRHDLSDQVGRPFGSDIVFYMGLLQNLNHLLSVMFRGSQ